MKFRTDFVTNSSSSCFLAFNINNPKLYRYLEEIGFSFSNTEKGRFTEKMTITLPSGESGNFDISENYWGPVLDVDTDSFSVWLTTMILSECGLTGAFGLMEKAGLVSGDGKLTDTDEEEQKELLISQLKNKITALDEGITDAEYKYAYNFEAEFGPAVYDQVKNGVRKKYLLEQYFPLDELEEIINPDEEDDTEYEDVYDMAFDGRIGELMERAVNPELQVWDEDSKSWVASEESEEEY